jgi:hypothetical protein
MVEDIEVAEEVLRIILQKPGLKVIKCEVQRFLRNTGAHSVVLDLLCEDENHSMIHVEVQKRDDDDHQKRVRFNISNIDTVFTEKGIKYELMQYFKKSVGEHENFMKLCKRVKYFKESQEGVASMCQVLEEYAAEKVKAKDIQTAIIF